MLLEQIVERGPADSELTGGATDVAFRPKERVHDHLPLHTIPRLAQGQPLARGGGRDPEVAGLDEAAPGHDDRALHGVLELADVARPRVVGDGGQGIPAELQLAAVFLAAAPPESI